jgi:dynein heavy chain
VQRADCPDRDRFDAFIKHIASMGLVDGERVAATQLPARSLYEYCFDTGEGVWKSWRSYLQPYEPPGDGAFSKILVPTVDVIRCEASEHAGDGFTPFARRCLPL